MNFDFNKLIPKLDEQDKDSLIDIFEKFRQEAGVSELLTKLGASEEEGTEEESTEEGPEEMMGDNTESEPSMPMRGKNLKHVLTIAIENKKAKGE